ncbi:unnamed protein product [Mytilus coruscus]|uniref:Ig-like domain-containing protein n=1 Tax=Mytilus coruscus TaxID=42192 RepID=A0A6J7ZXB4_MYTCO|nr:unnamed protein product [Mytilus coruscus]
MGRGFWIGLTDHDTKNSDWTWNDGTKLQSTDRWAHGHPNDNIPPKECVVYGTRGWFGDICRNSRKICCQKHTDITVNEGESVTLTCLVKDMHDITSLYWTRSVDGTSVIVSEYARGGNITSHSLVFGHVKWTDEGSYKCNVKNSSGAMLTVETRLFVNATNMHPCRCAYKRKLEHWGSKLIQNRTRRELLKELESELQKMKKDLEVNKTQLSSSIRKRTSAPDKRKSSETIGLAGTTFICIVVGLIILIDILTIIKFLTPPITFCIHKKMERDKTKSRKRQLRKKIFQKLME